MPHKPHLIINVSTLLADDRSHAIISVDTNSKQLKFAVRRDDIGRVQEQLAALSLKWDGRAGGKRDR